MLKRALLVAAAAIAGSMMVSAPASAQYLLVGSTMSGEYIPGGPVYFNGRVSGPVVSGYTLATGELGERVYVRNATVVTGVVGTPVLVAPIIHTRGVRPLFGAPVVVRRSYVVTTRPFARRVIHRATYTTFSPSPWTNAVYSY